MISVEQYRKAIGGFAGGLAGGKRIKIDNTDNNINKRKYNETTDILIYHFIIYICYTVLMIALLGLMFRSTPPSVKLRNEGQFWFDINI